MNQEKISQTGRREQGDTKNENGIFYDETEIQPQFPGNNYAGFWIRLVAEVIDLTCITIVSGIAVMIIFTILWFSSPSPVLTAVLFLCSPVISWGYFALQESSPAQATFGKRALGVMVVNEKSETISLVQASVRWLIKFIPVVNLISYLILIINLKKQGLHDMAAHTYVVVNSDTQQAVPARRTGKYLFAAIAIIIVIVTVFLYVELTSFNSSENLICDGKMYGIYSNGLQKLTIFLKVPENGVNQDLEDLSILWSTRYHDTEKIKIIGGIIAPGTTKEITLDIPEDQRPKAGEYFTLGINPKNAFSIVVSRKLSDHYEGGLIE